MHQTMNKHTNNTLSSFSSGQSFKAGAVSPEGGDAPPITVARRMSFGTLYSRATHQSMNEAAFHAAGDDARAAAAAAEQR
mmetsp:Transcript_55478/g.126077  ORF Transcript_55478/g.126077 Transcript_55478/m.126077 type:complete len:80 (-) Transcript_55478:934-1173(-)